MSSARYSFRSPRTASANSTSAKYIRNGAKPKLPMDVAIEIKRKRDSGATIPELVQEYGVAKQTIAAAILRAEFGDGK